jgi:hypothetical protein
MVLERVPFIKGDAASIRRLYAYDRKRTSMAGVRDHATLDSEHEAARQ